ncbi:hypothetical protein FACS1894192_11110 [Bacilli bacterium]|nr:hypothetical protein FACS1894192_11110 [Bacilli bacterium]
MTEVKKSEYITSIFGMNEVIHFLMLQYLVIIWINRSCHVLKVDVEGLKSLINSNAKMKMDKTFNILAKSAIIAFNSEIVKKTAINLYVYLISKGWYRRAEKIEEELDKFLTEWDMEEKISLHIFKKFAKYKKEKSPELLEEIQDEIEMLKKLGVTGIANRFAMDIERYCKSD